jgi:hypothetical protein
MLKMEKPHPKYTIWYGCPKEYIALLSNPTSNESKESQSSYYLVIEQVNGKEEYSLYSTLEEAAISKFKQMMRWNCKSTFQVIEVKRHKND